MITATGGKKNNMKLSITASLVALLLISTQLDFVAASEVPQTDAPPTEVVTEIDEPVEPQKEPEAEPSFTDEELLHPFEGESAEEELEEGKEQPAGEKVSKELSNSEVLLEALNLYRQQEQHGEPSVPPTLSAFASASRAAGQQIQEAMEASEALPGSGEEESRKSPTLEERSERRLTQSVTEPMTEETPILEEHGGSGTEEVLGKELETGKKSDEETI